MQQRPINHRSAVRVGMLLAATSACAKNETAASETSSPGAAISENKDLLPAAVFAHYRRAITFPPELAGLGPLFVHFGPNHTAALSAGELPSTGVMQKMDVIPINADLTFQLYVHERHVRVLGPATAAWIAAARVDPCSLLPNAAQAGGADVIDKQRGLLWEPAPVPSISALCDVSKVTTANGACWFGDYPVVAAACVPREGELRASPLAITARSLTKASDWITEGDHAGQTRPDGPRPTSIRLRVYNLSPSPCADPANRTLLFEHTAEYRVVTPPRDPVDSAAIPTLDVASSPVTIAPGGSADLYVFETPVMHPYTLTDNDPTRRLATPKQETLRWYLQLRPQTAWPPPIYESRFVFEFWR